MFITTRGCSAACGMMAGIKRKDAQRGGVRAQRHHGRGLPQAVRFALPALKNVADNRFHYFSVAFRRIQRDEADGFDAAVFQLSMT